MIRSRWDTRSGDLTARIFCSTAISGTPTANIFTNRRISGLEGGAAAVWWTPDTSSGTAGGIGMATGAAGVVSADTDGVMTGIVSEDGIEANCLKFQ